MKYARKRLLLLAFLTFVLPRAAYCQETEKTVKSNESLQIYDGEDILKYSFRLGLPLKKNIDLGNNEFITLVLVPAGNFEMGQAVPSASSTHIITLWLSSVLLFIIVILSFRTFWKIKSFRFTLFRLVVFVAVLGTFCGSLAYFYYIEQEDHKSFDIAEAPCHIVSITSPFYMSETEISQRQYFQVMNRNPSYFKGPNLPVDSVTWKEANEFCQTISLRTRENARLPTEAEWERSCRGLSKKQNADSKNLITLEWHYETSGNTTHPVASVRPNVFGLYDMHGNVMEWCSDWYGSYPKEAEIDPKGPNQGSLKILKGGSWGSKLMDCRCSHRHAWSLDQSSGEDFGFRIVITVTKPIN